MYVHAICMLLLLVMTGDQWESVSQSVSQWGLDLLEVDLNYLWTCFISLSWYPLIGDRESSLVPATLPGGGGGRDNVQH